MNKSLLLKITLAVKLNNNKTYFKFKRKSIHKELLRTVISKSNEIFYVTVPQTIV